MSHIEAMKQAIEALEKTLRYHGVMVLSDPPQDAWKYHRVEQTVHEAITSLRQAIAEAQDIFEAGRHQGIKQEHAMWMMSRAGQEIEAKKQEPVLWQWKDSEMVTPFDKTNVEGWNPLYTHPQPKREPLTGEHPLMVFAKECVLGAYQESELANAAHRAIEAAHGIKENT